MQNCINIFLSNIGATFVRLIDTHFPKKHPLHPLFNRNTVKISYRCLPNLGQIISKHNSKVTKKLLDAKENVQQNPQNLQQNQNLQNNCNYQNKEKCPLLGQCQTKSEVYQATVLSEGSKNQTYIGLTAGTFKKVLMVTLSTSEMKTALSPQLLHLETQKRREKL
jgi:hypothetical protein